MSRETRPVPGLFGGVSQQIPAMRNPTQCSVQRNFLATTVDGLYTRPGAQHLGSLALLGSGFGSTGQSYGDAFGHYIPRPDGSLYVAVIIDGSLMVFNADTGAAQTVNYPAGVPYLATPKAAAESFAALTLADYTFIVNNTVSPAMGASVAPSNNPLVTYIDVRTAVANVTYSVKVDAAAPVTYAASSTPTQGEIADALGGLLVTALTGTHLVQRLSGTNVIKVTKNALPQSTYLLYDTWDTNTMRNLSEGVPAYAELPYRFEMGYTLSVDGTPENNRDTYYVTWNGTQWEETVKPGLQTGWLASSMPHQLYQDLDGTWTFKFIDTWGQRKAGDDDSAPPPSFEGQPIRDLFFFRNRLGFLTGDSTVLSRAGDYFEFFPRTSTQILDNDPIDLASPVDGVTYFSSAVPFNQNLLIWTDAAQQLVLTGGDILSPKTARLVPASTFSADPSARPGALGNRAVFSEAAGEFASLSSYRVAQDSVTNTAAPLTEHVPRYVPAGPRQLAVSTSAKRIVVLPREASKSLKTFRYELDEDGEQYTQRAWSDIELASQATTVRAIAAHWKGLKLYLLMHYTAPGDGGLGGRFCSEVIDFQRLVVDPGLDHALCLDRRLKLTGGVFNGTTTTYTIPYTDPGVGVFRCAPGKEPYPLTSAVFTPANWETTVALPGDTRGDTLWAGVRYSASYEFTEALLRDTNGVPIQAATMKLLHYLLNFKDSSRARAVVTPYLRSPYTYEFGGRVLGLPLHGAEQKALSSGNFRVPVDAKADGTTVVIETDSLLEVVIPYAEWVAEVTMKARR